MIGEDRTLNAQMPKICVFCGHPVQDPSTKRERAREHVFPAWALEEFGVTRDAIEFSVLEASREDRASLQTTIQEPVRKFDLNNFLLGAVCSVCNNGWMSRLETRVRPNLRLLIGDASATAFDDRRALAKWALKTAYVLWRYLEPPIGDLPRSHGKKLIGDGTSLPGGVAVFTRQAMDWRIWFSLCMTFAVETAADRTSVQHCYSRAYKVLLQFGHAQFLVQHFPLPKTEVAYDPAICALLSASLSAVADPTLAISSSGVADMNFQFALSNMIRPLSLRSGGAAWRL